MKLKKAYIGLGSNLGDTSQNLTHAIRKIDDLSGRVLKQSQFFQSEPWGFESPNNFLNAVILIETRLSPIELLNALQTIENELGRIEKTQNSNYEDRIIDLDILLYEGVQMNSEELKIPHPHMKERDFVMIPLMEIWEDI